MKKLTILIVLFILAVSLFTGCGISKDSYDAAVKEANDLRDQLSEVQDDLTTAQDNLSQSNADLAAAQQNLNNVLDDRDLILKQLEETEADLTSAQDQLESVDSLITSLQSQVTTLESQVTPLQSQIDQLQEIIDLSLYSTEADAVTVHQISGASSNIVSFIADYAGYIVVSGTSTTVDGYIYLTASFEGYPYNYYKLYFSTGTTLRIPVLPGTINVYLSNTNPVGLTATITVTYYY
jgi:septal ring factor EnvC (AmiA/AmiB activator)